MQLKVNRLPVFSFKNAIYYKCNRLPMLQPIQNMYTIVWQRPNKPTSPAFLSQRLKTLGQLLHRPKFSACRARQVRPLSSRARRPSRRSRRRTGSRRTGPQASAPRSRKSQGDPLERESLVLQLPSIFQTFRDPLQPSAILESKSFMFPSPHIVRRCANE